jgi:hypothetical protein
VRQSEALPNPVHTLLTVYRLPRKPAPWTAPGRSENASYEQGKIRSPVQDGPDLRPRKTEPYHFFQLAQAGTAGSATLSTHHRT